MTSLAWVALYWIILRYNRFVDYWDTPDIVRYFLCVILASTLLMLLSDFTHSVVNVMVFTACLVTSLYLLIDQLLGAFLVSGALFLAIQLAFTIVTHSPATTILTVTAGLLLYYKVRQNRTSQKVDL